MVLSCRGTRGLKRRVSGGSPAGRRGTLPRPVLPHLVERAPAEDRCGLLGVAVAERLQSALLAPVQVAGRDHLISASIGVALSDGPLQDIENLIRDADAAMYRAKERGRGRYELFDQQMRHRTLARVRINDELQQVIERDELRLYCQPIVSLQTGGILGVEALVRWQHPDRGIVPPGDFIPAAEQAGLIKPIGRWVLNEACRQMSAWNQLSDRQETRSAPSFVAVNISGRQMDDETLPATIERLLSEHHLTPGQLHLEITESVLLEDTDQALVLLNGSRTSAWRSSLTTSAPATHHSPTYDASPSTR